MNLSFKHPARALLVLSFLPFLFCVLFYNRLVERPSLNLYNIDMVEKPTFAAGIFVASALVYALASFSYRINTHLGIAVVILLNVGLFLLVKSNFAL